MTTKTAAVRKPSGQQGTSTKSRAPKAKATVRPIGERIAEALATFGGSAKSLSDLARLSEEYATATHAVEAWSSLATEYAGTARAWADLTQGDPNTLGRLRGVRLLLDSSKKGKGTRAMTPAECVKVANAKTVGAVKAAAKAMDDGADPFNLKGSTAGTHKPNAGQPRTAKATALKISPETAETILADLIKVAPHISKRDTAVAVARLATTLAGIATQRAATLGAPVKGTRVPSSGEPITPATVAAASKVRANRAARDAARSEAKSA